MESIVFNWSPREVVGILLRLLQTLLLFGKGSFVIHNIPVSVPPAKDIHPHDKSAEAADLNSDRGHGNADRREVENGGQLSAGQESSDGAAAIIA